MNNQDLIEILKKLPPDARVDYMRYSEGDTAEVRKVEYDEDIHCIEIK